MTSILSPEAFQLATEEYAKQMGFINVDGTTRPISSLAAHAIEAAIYRYLLEDNRLGELVESN